MSGAVFRDDNRRWTWISGTLELDLGYGDAGRYMYARARNWRESRQVCDHGWWLGTTLMWPGQIVDFGAEVTNRFGYTFRKPIYESWDDARLLAWLGRHLDARTYKTRAAYERHARRTGDEATDEDMICAGGSA